MTVYAFVVDINEKPLSPTRENNAWYLIRKKKAVLKSKYPMVIQLNKGVSDEKQDISTFVCGIDDGSKHVGIGIVQNGKKAVFTGEIEQRQDVKSLMDLRRIYRKYRRRHKRYRKTRFNNRASSKRKDRISPSVKQKREAVLRVVNQLQKWIPIHKIVLEDVQIDVRKLTEGRQLYQWQYQQSNRLDENLRKATLIRDDFMCQQCSKKNCKLEVHHITPRRFRGADTLKNLITLCSVCHESLGTDELNYAEHFYTLIEGKHIRFDYAQHVMQGKHYLRNELAKISPLELTTGCDTANKRIDYDIEKSHTNDALVIAGLKNSNVFIQPYKIRPMRRKLKAKVEGLNGFQHRDFIKYTKKNGEEYIGWITALSQKRKTLNITTIDGKVLKRYGIGRCTLLWRFQYIYWMI
ncbi:RNA-guided endonuclease IscB [Bacillus sp. 3103sda1]|uniref:RNA-guided endonuclease IscB n=1 Tax=Bacillus sp. 3103sda1 TaxID=2953808 RepID=UPI00209E53AC|nr:RNA-guided endonuclease IscB [Bacillus sp. 3103sda1]MCP1126129.1 RNA-guided endonuclease IscB [Bacillus sp. 3103sda1]